VLLYFNFWIQSQDFTHQSEIGGSGGIATPQLTNKQAPIEIQLWLLLDPTQLPTQNRTYSQNSSPQARIETISNSVYA
jgi:hypothetical protein